MIESIKKYISKIEKQFKKTNANLWVPHNEGSEMVRLNGTPLVIRPAGLADAERLFEMHKRLTRKTLYFRYLALHQPTVKEMETVCNLSGRLGAAIVVQRKNPQRTIIALAYYRLNPIHLDKPPELAIVVEDRFQGMGVGKALLKYLCQQAAATGIKTILASIHPQNHRMRHLLYHSAYPFDQSIDDSTLEATIHLRPDAAFGRRRLFNPSRLADPYAGLDLGLHV